MRHKNIFIIESLGQHMHRITKITQLNMVTRGDFKEHLNQIEKLYIRFILYFKKNFFFWGGGVKEDEVFSVL